MKITNLSSTQLSFQPTPEAWSIAGILEHLVIIQGFILGPIREQLAAAPESDAEAPVAEVDAFIRANFADRTHKISAPPPVSPTGASFHASLESYQANNLQLQALLDAGNINRRQRIESKPLLEMSGERYRTMDLQQWILATFAHNERHMRQIEEWMAHPAFPKA